MEAKIYFFVKALCFLALMYNAWILLFGHKAYALWDKLFYYLRILRVALWKYRKKRMRERKKSQRRKKRWSNKKTPEEPTENTAPEFSVVGKSKTVYLEDPEVARKTPVRSLEMEKVPIEEDADINPNDVNDDGFTLHRKKGLTKEDIEELTAPVGAAEDPEFSQALTYEQLVNVADVLTKSTKEEEKVLQAAETLYQIKGSDIYRFMAMEVGTQEEIDNLLNDYMDSKSGSNKKRAINIKERPVTIDWSKYM